jgi:hypothetical protein
MTTSRRGSQRETPPGHERFSLPEQQGIAVIGDEEPLRRDTLPMGGFPELHTGYPAVIEGFQMNGHHLALLRMAAGRRDHCIIHDDDIAFLWIFPQDKPVESPLPENGFHRMADNIAEWFWIAHQRRFDQNDPGGHGRPKQRQSR